VRQVKWIGALLFENLPWKLLSLAIAVVIWALVATEPELTTNARAGLEYKNLPEGLEIASDPLTSVILELHGPAGELRGMGESVHPTVVLDLSAATPGKHTYAVSDSNVKAGHGVTLVGAKPPRVQFEFEARRVTNVPIQVRFTGEGQNGYAIQSYKVEPTQESIMGPRNHVARVTAAITDAIDLSNVTGTVQIPVSVFVEDAYVRFVSAPGAVVTVTMKKKQ
jgi:YbbR domain-containing protein